MSGERISKKTDDEIREMAAGISRDYFDLMKHLRDARAALTRAEQTLDLIGPTDLPRHVALDDLVLSIQASAGLIGRRTGTSERERAARRGPGGTCAPLESGGLRQVQAYLDQARAREPEAGQ